MLAVLFVVCALSGCAGGANHITGRTPVGVRSSHRVVVEVTPVGLVQLPTGAAGSRRRERSVPYQLPAKRGKPHRRARRR